MPDATLTDPRGALRIVSDFTTGKDSAGNPLNDAGDYDFWRANDTIVFGDLVGLVAPTATVPISVEKLDVSDAFASFVCVGVAQEGGVAGDTIKVLNHGITLINIGDTAAIAIGDAVIKHATTDGAAGKVAVASIDATIITGNVFGNYLAGEIGTTDQAIAYIRL
jgi:hypothetical protein